MSKSLKRLFIFLFFCTGFVLSGQVNSVSPYSRLGLGELYPDVYSRSLGFGGASQALYNPLNINSSNPASYTDLQLTTFSTGFELTFLRQNQSNPDISIENSRSGMRYFSFGLPLTNWWGSAVGLQPYSFKGYDISTQRSLNGKQITDNFSGSGGLNKLYWGNAFEVAEGLSIGVNVGYLFGSLEETETTRFEDGTFLGTRSVTDVEVSDIIWDYGVKYEYDFPNDRILSVGASYSNTSDINAQLEAFQYTVSGSNPVDTLNNGTDQNTTATLPGEFNVGVSFGKTHEQIINPAWNVSADFELYQGQDFKPARGQGNLNNGYKIQVGGFITPRYTFESLERNTGYLNKMEYRLGGFYENTPITLGGRTLKDYGITFGIGLPVRQQNLGPGEVKISTINIGVNAGRRGTLSDGLIQEEYLSFYVGISFNDKWFIDYKYR